MEENASSPTRPIRSTRRKVTTVIVIAAVLALIGYLAVHKTAVEMDRKDRIPQANCLVLDKTKIDNTEPDLYLIETSCGNYEAVKRMNNFLKVGSEYDMQVTKGNWARGPRLAVAGGCAEPSQSPQPSQPTEPAVPSPPTNEEPTIPPVQEEPPTPTYSGPGHGA